VQKKGYIEMTFSIPSYPICANGFSDFRGKLYFRVSAKKGIGYPQNRQGKCT